MFKESNLGRDHEEKEPIIPEKRPEKEPPKKEDEKMIDLILNPVRPDQAMVDEISLGNKLKKTEFREELLGKKETQEKIRQAFLSNLLNGHEYLAGRIIDKFFDYKQEKELRKELHKDEDFQKAAEGKVLEKLLSGQWYGAEEISSYLAVGNLRWERFKKAAKEGFPKAFSYGIDSFLRIKNLVGIEDWEIKSDPKIREAAERALLNLRKNAREYGKKYLDEDFMRKDLSEIKRIFDLDLNDPSFNSRLDEIEKEDMKKLKREYEEKHKGE
jgi:hypothetical protein